MMDFEFMTYKRLLHKNVRKNVFKIQWGGIMIRNMNRKKRKLLKYKTVADYKKKRVAAMVLCKLKVFRDGTRLFPIYVCPICTKMKGVENLGMNQRRRDILKHRCVHSRMCQDISEDWGNWRSHWPLNLQNINQLEAYEVNVNEDIKFETYLHENEFLACVKNDRNQISILHSISPKSITPMCYSCQRQGCRCYYLYNEEVKELHRRMFPDEEIEVQWRRTESPTEPPNHFLYPASYNEYGYNRQPFYFPFHRDSIISDIIQENNGTMNVSLPQQLIPKFSPSLKCPHKNLFNHDDSQLKLLYKNITIYSETKDEIHEIPLYGRPSAGSCQGNIYEMFLSDYGKLSKYLPKI